MFVCNRGDTIQYHGGLQHLRKLGQTPMLQVFLTPRPALSSHQHRTLVCLFLIWEPTLCSQWNSKSHYCSPRVLRAAGCIQQPKSLFLQHLASSSSYFVMALVAPLLLLNPDWGDFEQSLCICWSFTSPLSPSFFRIIRRKCEMLQEGLAIS